MTRHHSSSGMLPQKSSTDPLMARIQPRSRALAWQRSIAVDRLPRPATAEAWCSFAEVTVLRAQGARSWTGSKPVIPSLTSTTHRII